MSPFPASRAMRVLAPAIAIAIAIAGCVAAPVDPAGVPAPPVLADALAALEAGEPSANLELLGEWKDGNGAEADAWGDLLFVDAGPAVVVLNVSDPTEPVEVARVPAPPGVSILDVKVSDDGKFLFIGDDQEASGGAKGGKAVFTGGIYAFDITDIKSAKLVAYQPIGERRGPHMIAYHRMPDGREILMGANADVSIVEFDREAKRFTELARYQADLVTAFNRDPEVFDVLYQGWAHDMFAMDEPDGSTFMYVANWDAGVRIVDITDPARPKELGGWNEFPKGHEGNLHTVSAEWIDGRRIVVGAVEVGFLVVGGIHYLTHNDRSIVYVWDATDPANIELLGFWENPGKLPSGRDNPVFGEEVTSTHNLQLEGGRIYLAHYGLGVWTLDVSTPEAQAAPGVLAYYQEPDLNVWDVVLREGALHASGAGGVRSLRFVGDVLGEGGRSSRA